MEVALNPPGRLARPEAALRIAAVAATVALMVLLTFVPVSSNDFWLQARIGELILQTGDIPRTLLFPFTWAKDLPFNAHEWLPSVLFHLMDRLLGRDGLLFAQGAVGLLLFGSSMLLARRLSGSLGAALLLSTMAMVVANYRFHLRPEAIALLLLLLQLLVLSKFRRDRRAGTLLWSLPIAIVWANSHGSFLLGPVVAGIFSAGEAGEALRSARGPWSDRARKAAAAAAPYAAVACAMALASLLNPLGFQLLRFAVELSASEVTKAYIAEWNPTLSRQFMIRPPFWIFLAALTACTALLIACRRRVTCTDVLLFVAFAGLAFQRTRFVALFGYVALAVCARVVGDLPGRQARERALLGVAVLVAVAGIALALRFGNVWGGFPFQAPTANFTAPMRERLLQPDMRGNVFTSYELGAELTYLAYPRLRPSIDSRIDSYGDQYFLMHDAMMVDDAPLKALIDDFDVQYMLLLRRDYERMRKLKLVQAGWQVDLADSRAVLLKRR